MKVLEAAVERLLDDGYDGLKVRDVARLADVAETTIYRRWPTTHDLAAAAVGHLARADNPIPDTGTLEGDLGTLLGQILNLLRRPEVERILRVAAALDSRDHGAVDARKAFWRSRFLGSSRIVERAIDRGELPVGTDPDELIEFLVAPAYLRLLLLDRPLDSALLDLSVHNTLAAYAVGRQNP
ncbi:TetR/AcrR family transcriptional regulator [Mycobacterium sp. IS-1556]|uniref:TetR/AcrR family transcriptional regulator n=1 Tax=Mycobacterium sp. IS-1556 TaxID=1772276 RepID=UPI00074157B1|nr:TetR/AcrR family transcriptional regulator [Mycobacterium sp. IS-1556]KUH81221.1 hypothetical protein AU187_00390 [Mycobacterium sp. IS-1556]